MRVAIFIDGKNFYSGWKQCGAPRIESYRGLAQWLVEQAGGSYFAGAHYYTGIEPEDDLGTNALLAFLDRLEMEPGFFVFRFQRKARQQTCPECGHTIRFTTEKEVDTTLVADMLRLAAVSAFDVAVVLSGDGDLAPAVEGVRSLGKQVYVATWGGHGLAPRMRRAAFDHIDLLRSFSGFGAAPTERGDVQADDVAVADGLAAFEAELALAEERFAGGFVGVNFFLGRWRSERLTRNIEVRHRILARLERAGRVLTYDSPDGDRAMRLAEPGERPPDAAPLPLEAGSPPASPDIVPPSDTSLAACAGALADAERHFTRTGGFVGRAYFVSKWRAPSLTGDPAERQRLVDELIAAGVAEEYEVDGNRALRTPAPA